MDEIRELIITVSLAIAGALAVIILLYLGIAGSVGFTISWHHFFPMSQRIDFVSGAVFIVIVAGAVIYLLYQRE